MEEGEGGKRLTLGVNKQKKRVGRRADVSDMVYGRKG